jgi:hypothetical protein
MGMFDTVVTKCPKCGSRNEIQTKAGECCLSVYSIDSVPVEIARSLDGQKRFCQCGHKFRTVWPKTMPIHVKMDIEDIDHD